jgi:hypothetical protein
MLRKCSLCHKEFTPQELAHEETAGMEAERQQLGLHGVFFSYYACSACGGADIFLDVHALAGESDDVFRLRRGALEAAINQVDGEGVKAVLVETAEGTT